MSKYKRLQAEAKDLADRLTSDGRAHFLGALMQIVKDDATTGVLTAVHRALTTTASSTSGEYLRTPEQQEALEDSMRARFPKSYPAKADPAIVGGAALGASFAPSHP